MQVGIHLSILQARRLSRRNPRNSVRQVHLYLARPHLRVPLGPSRGRRVYCESHIPPKLMTAQIPSQPMSSTFLNPSKFGTPFECSSDGRAPRTPRNQYPPSPPVSISNIPMFTSPLPVPLAPKQLLLQTNQGPAQSAVGGLRMPGTGHRVEQARKRGGQRSISWICWSKFWMIILFGKGLSMLGLLRCSRRSW
jgi:hypothetical protein